MYLTKTNKVIIYLTSNTKKYNNLLTRANIDTFQQVLINLRVFSCIFT